MIFYTIWKKHGDDITLIDEEPTLFTKGAAFKRAREMRKDLIYGTSDAIVVRKITEGSLDCIQWVFEPRE